MSYDRPLIDESDIIKDDDYYSPEAISKGFLSLGEGITTSKKIEPKSKEFKPNNKQELEEWLGCPLPEKVKEER